VCKLDSRRVDSSEKGNVTSHPWGHAMAQAVSLRSPTAEARVRSRVNPCGICGGKSGTGTGFSPGTSVLPLLGKMKKTDHLSLHLHHNCCTISLKAAVRP
jgi:hypothetical protein